MSEYIDDNGAGMDGWSVEGPSIELPLDEQTVSVAIGPLKSVIIVDDVLTPGQCIEVFEMLIEKIREVTAVLDQRYGLEDQ